MTNLICKQDEIIIYLKILYAVIVSCTSSIIFIILKVIQEGVGSLRRGRDVPRRHRVTSGRNIPPLRFQSE